MPKEWSIVIESAIYVAVGGVSCREAVRGRGCLKISLCRLIRWCLVEEEKARVESDTYRCCSEVYARSCAKSQVQQSFFLHEY